MRQQDRARKDRVQNLLIALLSVTAVLLFAQTQMSNLGLKWTQDRFSNLLDSGSVQTPGADDLSLAGLSAPVQVAVHNSTGRSGQRYTTTANAALADLSTRLGEALGSAGGFNSCQDGDLRRALAGKSVSFDFGYDLPLSVLAGLLGMEASYPTYSARLLVLGVEGSMVRLYLRSDNGSHFVSGTAVSAVSLLAELESYEGAALSFAYELGEQYDSMAPYTLLGEEAPVCPLLSAASALSDSDALLRQLDFNPYTNNRYPDSASGAEVIVEGGRNLRLQNSGLITYRSNEADSTLTIPSADGQPTKTEAALGAWTLAQKLLDGRLGEAEVYLTGVEQDGGRTRVSLGYHRQGVPIRFSDGSQAMELELNGAVIVSLSLHLRQYGAGDSNSLLLPMAQAVAVARSIPGGSLNAAYVDNGAASLSACWLAD